MDAPLLAFCTTALGDVMFCTPAIAALGSSFTLDVVVHEKRAPLLLNNPHIRTIYKYRNNPYKRALLSLKLRGREYQSIAMLHVNDDVYKMLPWLRYGRAVNIQGWDIPGLKLSSLPRLPGQHTIDRRLLVAQACGARMPAVEQRKPEIYLSDEEMRAARQWLEQRGIQGPVVGMVAGASNLVRSWPAANFARLARELEQMGLPTLVLGAKNEIHLLRAFKDAGVKSFIPAFDLDLRFLASLVSQLSLLVSNDTGPLHLAHALEIPMVSLFGISDPGYLAPRHRLNHIVSVYPQLTADNYNTIMSSIDYGQVLAATKRALNWP